MPVASLLQHHKRIQSSDLSARGNDSGGGMGVGPRKGVKGGLGERIGREGPQVLDLQ